MAGNSSSTASESFIVDMKDPKWPVIISFAGLGDQFQFRNMLSEMNVNVIYVRDLKHNWYLNGIPDIGNNVEEVKDFFVKKAKGNSSIKVITIGASAGGFAALLYGTLIQADVVMTFSPQTFVNRFRRLIYWDTRWKDRISEIYRGDKSNRNYLDLRPLVKNYIGSVQLFFDANHRLDSIHAKRLDFKNVTYFPSSEGGHTLAKHLKDSGKLKEYLENILQ
jgi:hypothetical protein